MSEPWIDTQRAMLSCSNIMISYNNGVLSKSGDDVLLLVLMSIWMYNSQSLSLPALNVTSQNVYYRNPIILHSQAFISCGQKHHSHLHTISQLHERTPRRSKYGCPIKKLTTPNLQCLTSTELHLMNDKQAQPLYRIIQSAYNAIDVYDDTHWYL